MSQKIVPLGLMVLAAGLWISEARPQVSVGSNSIRQPTADSAAQVTAKIQAVLETIDRLYAEFDSLMAMIVNTREQLDVLVPPSTGASADAIAAYQAQADALTSRLDQELAAAAKLQKEISEAQKNLSDLQNQMSAAQAKDTESYLRQLELARQELEATMSELSQEQSGLSSDRQRLNVRREPPARSSTLPAPR